MKTTKPTPKEFALEQIIPYYKNPSICGITSKNNCAYLTEDGKMCVVGKNMLNPKKWAGDDLGVKKIFKSHTQEEVLKSEIVGVLTNDQWHNLQAIHDRIALGWGLVNAIKSLGLFTLGELIEASNKI